MEAVRAPGAPRTSSATYGAPRASSPLTLVVLTSSLPYPLTDGWRIRTFHLLKALASRHRVTLLSFQSELDSPAAVATLGRMCDRVRTVRRRHRYSAGRVVAGILGSTPFSVLNYRSPGMHSALAEILAAGRYDALHVEDIHMAQYASAVKGLPKVLDMHNIESLLLERYARAHSPSPRSLYAALTAAKLRRYEARHAPEFDHVLTCSDVDRRYAIEALGCPSVRVIPNGVHPGDPPPSADVDSPPTLVYVGRMDYVANEDAALHLASDILPIVWRTYPQARLYVVGQRPSRRVLALAADPRIAVTGFVPEVGTFLARATIFVAPLRYGSGTRLKILEAMAMARPVVSTSLGCEGLDLTPGEHAIIADSASSFADAVVALLGSPTSRADLGQRARRYALRRFSWPSIESQLLNIYETLCPGRSSRSGRADG